MAATTKTRTGRIRRVLLRLTVGALALVAVIATVGTLTTTNVATVTRTTTASADGPFQHGATSEVKVNDQPARTFEIIEYSPPYSRLQLYGGHGGLW